MNEWDWYEGLSTRAANGLHSQMGFRSREEVLAAYHSGDLYKIQGIGKRTVHEICNWLGVPAPAPQTTHRRFSVGRWQFTITHTRD